MTPPESLPFLQPFDRHNRTLLAHGHPADWKNPTPKERYHLLVVGGGPAGLVAAIGAAGLGARVALVEKGVLGGDCLNVGCVPSKALIRSARAVADVRRAAEYGVRVPDGVTVDFPAVMERLRRLRAELSRHDAATRFRDLGIDVFLGSDGRFTAPDRFVHDGRSIHFAKACIATGARAAAPPIDGLADLDYLTNETVFSLTELPRRLGIIGAGPIGCEMAQAFARFGSEVHVVETAAGVLQREDRDAARVVEEALAGDGVRLRFGSTGLTLMREGKAGARMKFAAGGESHDVVVDAVLVSVGRRANVEGLGLEAAGVDVGQRGIDVDDRLRTSNPRIFAAGDVCSPYQFTHAADAMARVVITNALFPFALGRASRLTIPWCTYTDPELAQVGLSEATARERKVPFRTFRVDFARVDRAVVDGETDGFLKVLTAPKGGRILGATLVGARAGDVISEVAVAMAAGAGLGTIARTIHPYPTRAEIVKKSADAYSASRLTPFAKRAIMWLLSWQ